MKKSVLSIVLVATFASLICPGIFAEASRNWIERKLDYDLNFTASQRVVDVKESPDSRMVIYTDSKNHSQIGL